MLRCRKALLENGCDEGCVNVDVPAEGKHGDASVWETEEGR